ncbi:hypothetical protein FIBSPDRAFT_946762 [Athelia psychrophila]|uniref:Uncharacterized protein n=1 Tax=Athelia psychrophila TaxID=1759441 RepID=A0A166SIS2_9AGAM|nr:hypothetical protein FIBSPDRAFT_946762 [Fibularhizoctonia sp. CBS 109695]
MSESESPPPETTHDITFSASLTTYTKTGKKGIETKKTKIKEFKFSVSDDNYLELLRECLESQGMERYQVAAKQRFGFKVCDTLDVDDEKDYKNMVTSILADTPLKIKIIFDMKDVQQNCPVTTIGDRGDEDRGDEDSDLKDDETTFDQGEVTDQERELAHLRLKLEKAYGNPNGNTKTFIYADGTQLRLTPSMINEWTRALYDGETTIKQPPHSPTFDLTNRAPSLLPGGRGVSTSSSGSSDLAAVTTILNTLSNSTHSSHPPAPLPTELPPPALPVITTLTSLNRFLAHCQKDLGILGALDYKSPLQRHAYGPDILHKVELETLESLGIPAGNAIRLKDASQPWITGPLAKQKHGESSPECEPERTPKKQHLVEYEKWWYNDAGNESGSSRFTAPIMAIHEDGVQMEAGLQIYYKCTARDDWFPLPPGKASQSSRYVNYSVSKKPSPIKHSSITIATAPSTTRWLAKADKGADASWMPMISHLSALSSRKDTLSMLMKFKSNFSHGAAPKFQLSH